MVHDLMIVYGCAYVCDIQGWVFAVAKVFLPGQWKQEAQLLLRNRASAMYFFVAKLLSIAAMTHSYVYHLRSLRLMIRLIYYAHSE